MKTSLVTPRRSKVRVTARNAEQFASEQKAHNSCYLTMRTRTQHMHRSNHRIFANFSERTVIKSYILITLVVFIFPNATSFMLKPRTAESSFSARSPPRRMSTGEEMSHRHSSVGPILRQQLYKGVEGTNEYSTLKPSSASSRPWWPFSVKHSGASTSTSSSASTVSEESQMVDEYLEFLDRRYNRLHADERERRGGEKFSALKWLTQDQQSSSVEAAEAEQQQQDALYVLGLAGLASKRLLQKHHYPIPRENKEVLTVAKNVIDADMQTSADGPLAVFVSLMLAKVVHPVLRAFCEKREALIAFETKYLLNVIRASFKVLATAPRKISNAFWKLGGGRKSVGFTIALVTTVAVVCVRPLLGVLIKETSRHF